MRTLVLEHPERLVFTRMAPPPEPGPGEVLVRVHRVGVCGTDLHAFRGRQPFFSYPRILGHELGVEVRAVGEGVRHLAPGDRAAVEPYLNCGRCVACRRGKPNCCVELRVLGVHVDGGQREQLLVPAAKVHVSARLAYDQLALVETLGIGAHAVQRAEVQAGEVVAVLGAGPIGLATIQFACAAGARVLVVDVQDSRLAFVRDRLGLPAGDLVDGGRGDVAAQLRELTGGHGPATVFDATGNAQSMRSAFDFPAHGGRLVFIGLFPGEVSFHDPDFHRRELTLLASRNALPADFPRIITAIERGEVDTAPWITHRAALEDVPQRFAGWTRPESGVVKAMIDVCD